ncbi:MAG: hypothetical protein O4806_18970 [Trichodesmium sp. St5_bin8]|nr:hypothetical protein [Trichodesmium sp. St5_bin8]
MISPVLVEYLQWVVLFSRDSILRNSGMKAGFFHRQTPDLVMAGVKKNTLSYSVDLVLVLKNQGIH